MIQSTSKVWRNTLAMQIVIEVDCDLDLLCKLILSLKYFLQLGCSEVFLDALASLAFKLSQSQSVSQ